MIEVNLCVCTLYKEYGESGGTDSAFLTSALDIICQFHASATLLPVKSPGTHWGLCGPLYASEKSKICCSRQESNDDPSVVQPVV